MNIAVELQTIIDAERITTSPSILAMHGRDESYHHAHAPDVVVFPTTTDEVSKVLQFANQHHIPVTPFGLGSSLEGNAIPYHGGISISFQQMNKILELRPEDFLVRVQPGVTRSQLNKELKRYGLFFPVDPGADATLGGMASTNASGTTTVRYGGMRAQVRQLEVVLADGRVIRPGSLAAKSSAGYFLPALFVGSEGTLGIFTELTLQVHGIPEQTLAARVSFPTMEQAIQAVVSILTAGIPIARVEFVDQPSMKQVNAYSGTNYPEYPTLFLEFHGNEAGLETDAAFTQELVAEHGSLEFLVETDSKARAQLWEARHNIAYAYIHGFPGKKLMTTDVCLPISELAGAVAHTRQVMDEAGLDGGILGHVGDGNYHVALMIDIDHEAELTKAHQLNEQIVRYALERGGTCTGEHGVGIGKRKYLAQEHGSALDVMKAIKKTLDPHGILNPGKIFLD